MNPKDPHPNLVKAHELIKQRTTDDAEPSQELPIVRGWLMDELEKRNPVAFSCWLESNEPSPRKFFVV